LESLEEKISLADVLTVTGDGGLDDVNSSDVVDNSRRDDEDISSEDHHHHDVTESAEQQQQPVDGDQSSVTGGHQHHNRRLTVDRLLTIVSTSLTPVGFTCSIVFVRVKQNLQENETSSIRNLVGFTASRNMALSFHVFIMRPS